MSEIADLIVKIGADPSKLIAGMKEARASINQALNPNDIKKFQKALDGTSISLMSIVGKIGSLSLASRASLNLLPAIRGAVTAADNLDHLSATLGTTTAEASRFSKAMTLAGGDVQTAGTAIMRLDKTISGTGDSADKAKRVMEIFGVSLTDTNGKLLPVTEQMKQLSEGFKRASDAGYGQEYLLNTLGSRGLSLAGALKDYAEAAQRASEVQGVGLDVNQLHEIGIELDVLKMQAGQFGNIFGSAVAPLATDILPPLTSGLKTVAKTIADNREELGTLIRYGTEAMVIWKGLIAARTAYNSVSLTAAGVGVVKREIEQQNLLSRVQEAAIAKRVRMIDSMAAADEKRKIKEVQDTRASLAEQQKIIAEYTAKREALASQQSAAIQKAMRDQYAAEAAASVASANVQSAALKKVEGAAGLAGTGMEKIGVNATVAGAQTISTMGRVGTIISTTTKLVWAMAGGWLGVAAAVGAAVVQLYKFYKAERQKAANDKVYTYNGRNYQYDAEDNTMVRLKDNGTRMNVYDQAENDAAFAAAKEQGLNPDKAKAGQTDEYTKAQEEYKKALEDSRREMEEFRESIEAGSEAEKETTKAESVKMPKVTAPKEPVYQNVEVPVGQIAAQNAINAYTSAPGSQWENSELTTDLSNSCAAFVATMWRQAGIDALYTASGNTMDKKFQDAGAWHGEDWEQNLEPGDYVSGPKHVGMYVGNNQVISRDSSGGLQQRELQDWKNTFGFLGYGSIRQLTNGQTGTVSMSDAMASQQEALRKLQEAKDQAVTLFTQMQNEIQQQTGTAWGQGMDRIAQDVQAKQREINKLQGAGVPEEAIKQLESKLAEYRETLMDQVERKRKESLDKMTAETKRTNAETAGDYKAEADAEYEATVLNLDKEREEREKEVAKNKEDKEAMAAVEDWYASQVQAAAEKRTEAYRDAFEKQMKYTISHQDMSGFFNLMNSDEGREFIDWESQSQGMEKYYSTWKNLQMQAHESILSQVADISEATQGAFSDFFTSFLEGKETFGDAFTNLVDSIMESMVEQITEKWSAQITQAIFGSVLNPGGQDQNGGGGIGSNILSYGTQSLFGAGFGALTGAFSGGGGSDAESQLMGSIAKWTTGIDSASTATNLLTGATTGLNKITGTYNVVQTALATATKPAEQTTTVSTTAALIGLESAAYGAAAALSAVGFGGPLFASGGLITGPGTGTSDSILAGVSNGEYVLSADAVKRVGLPLLDAMNRGRVPHFASGGAVKISGGGSAGLSTPAGGNITLNVQAIDAASFKTFLSNGGLDVIKQLSLDDDRNFTGTTGVW